MAASIGSFTVEKFRLIVEKKLQELLDTPINSITQESDFPRLMRHITEENCQCTDGDCKWMRDMLYHDCCTSAAGDRYFDCFECFSISLHYWGHMQHCNRSRCSLKLCKETKIAASRVHAYVINDADEDYSLRSDDNWTSVMSQSIQDIWRDVGSVGEDRWYQDMPGHHQRPTGFPHSRRNAVYTGSSVDLAILLMSKIEEEDVGVVLELFDLTTPESREKYCQMMMREETMD